MVHCLFKATELLTTKDRHLKPMSLLVQSHSPTLNRFTEEGKLKEGAIGRERPILIKLAARGHHSPLPSMSPRGTCKSAEVALRRLVKPPGGNFVANQQKWLFKGRESRVVYEIFLQ